MTRDEAISAITNAAQHMGVPVAVALAMAQQESSMNPNEGTNKSGATGIMQIVISIHQRTALSHGWDIMTPEGNIMYGVWLIHQDILAEHGDVARGLMRYYGGGWGPAHPDSPVMTKDGPGPTPHQYAASILGLAGRMGDKTKYSIKGGDTVNTGSTGGDPPSEGSIAYNDPGQQVSDRVTPGWMSPDQAQNNLSLATDQFHQTVSNMFGFSPQQAESIRQPVQSLVDSIVQAHAIEQASEDARSQQGASNVEQLMLAPDSPGFDPSIGQAFQSALKILGPVPPVNQ